MPPGNPWFTPVADPIEGVVAFAVSLLVGGGAIHLAARYGVYRDAFASLTFEHGVLTALIGAVTWALLAWIPVIGTLLALVGWIAVVRWRYPGGWTKAAITGLTAWGIAVVALAALELLGVDSISALGIPGA